MTSNFVQMSNEAFASTYSSTQKDEGHPLISFGVAGILAIPSVETHSCFLQIYSGYIIMLLSGRNDCIFCLYFCK